MSSTSTGYKQKGSVSESASKYRTERMSSSNSLPRSPSNLDPPAVPERKFTNSAWSNSGRTTPGSLTRSDMDGEDHKKTLQDLNDRLVSYVEKVRKLQDASDVIDSIPRNGSEDTISVVKSQYEAAMAEWRAKHEAALGNLASLKIELASVKQENSQLGLKVTDKLGMLRDRDQTIASLEAEISEVLTKLNLLQNEKGKMLENEGVYKSDITDLKNDLDSARKALDRERIRASDLEAKLESMEQDMKLKVGLITRELEEERSRRQFDFSSIDAKLKDEYESRLKSELVKLRKMYEEQTEKAKNEFMYLHSDKLAELQELLSTERTSNSGSREEMKEIRTRMEQYKRTISDLEKERLQRDQQLEDLQVKLEEMGATFRSQMSSKDAEVKMLNKEIVKMREDYNKLVEIKQHLAFEIEAYRKIIEGEEKRIRKVSRRFTKMAVSGGKGGSSDSSSENETSSVDRVDGRRLGGSKTTMSSSSSMYSMTQKSGGMSRRM